MQLYRDLIIDTETKYYLVVKHDLLMYIAGIISNEIEGESLLPLVMTHQVCEISWDVQLTESNNNLSIVELSALEETTLGSDLAQGWGLHALVSIVKSFIDIELIRQKYVIYW